MGRTVLISVICAACHTNFKLKEWVYHARVKAKGNTVLYCSLPCAKKAPRNVHPGYTVACATCQTEFHLTLGEYNFRMKNNPAQLCFCGIPCKNVHMNKVKAQRKLPWIREALATAREMSAGDLTRAWEIILQSEGLGVERGTSKHLCYGLEEEETHRRNEMNKH